MNEKELLEELDKTENKKNVGDSYFLGSVLGLIVPFIALIFFNSAVTNNDSFLSMFNNLIDKKIFSAVLSVLSLSNLVIFFLFLKLNKMKTVKGIVAATVILAIIVYITKLFIQTSA